MGIMGLAVPDPVCTYTGTPKHSQALAEDNSHAHTEPDSLRTSHPWI